MPTITGRLSLSTWTLGEETILAATGRIVSVTVPQLRARLTDLIDTGHHRLVLDLTAVSSCNSTGLAVMVYALRQLLHRHADGHMFIACDGPVLRSFQHTGVTKILPVRPTLAQALSDATATSALSSTAQAARASSPTLHHTRHRQHRTAHT